MSSINFDNPYLLLLAIPIVALFVVPYAIAIRKDNLNGHNVASGIIHIIMALIIAFVAAGTSIVTTVTETSVYVVADVSYSASKNLDAVDGYISSLSKSLPRNSKMGVVTFAKYYELLTPLGGKVKSVKESSAGIDDSATDIIGALRYTGELFREDVIKRIVLITDGKQTAETDANALKRQVDALAERNIRVDAIYLDDNIKDDAKEVQLSAVQVTPTTFLGGEVSARITVNCSCSTALDEHGEPYAVNTFLDVKRIRTDIEDAEPVEYDPRLISFTRGRNYYDLPLYTDEAGVYDYEVRIRTEKPAEDENTLNNVISFTQEVAGKQSVLVIYDDPADEKTIIDAYDDTADIQSYYYESRDIVTTLDWINQFDEIVLATANVTKIGSRGNEESTNYKQFLTNLDTAVSTFGKSLVTFGDTNIQNNTHGELKQLSDMLPVVYSKGEGDSKLYTLLIDTSRSMEQHGRLARAKRAAIEVINMLDDSDTVYVVQFNGSTGVVQPGLVKLSEGRQQLIDEINSLTVHQSTNIPKALQDVVRVATGGKYSERRLLLFSDGMNFTTDTATQSVRTSILTLLQGGVVTSTLDVGRAGASQDAADAALDLLKNIKTWGGGKYMDISSDKDLKEVLEAELPSDVNNSQGSESNIKVKRRTDEMLKDIDTAALQSDANAMVNKFIYSRAKGAATTVLAVDFETIRTVEYEDGNTETVYASTEVPLYSYWDYGNGKVASFTTGLSIGDTDNYWIYMSTEMRANIIRGILRTNVPEQKISEPFMLEIQATDGYAEVSLTPGTRMTLNEITSIEITSPNGRTTNPVSLTPAGTKYTYTFITGDEGKYTVKIRYKERATAEEYTVECAVHVAYSSEYDRFALYDAGTLHKMIGAQGTVSENGRLTIVNDEKDVGLYNVSLSVPLLAACVALYAVDIAVRKLKWEDIKSLFKSHKKG